MDERPLRNQNEINPDVLGYIFEKYINQKQMGAYYTKEYITRSTVLPRLVNMMREHCKVAFEGDTAVWRYLAEDPDHYIFPAVRHGVSIDWRTGKTLDAPVPLPEDIAAGLDHIPSRTGWNRRAPDEAGLPTEIWREVIARRRRYDEVREKLASGSVRSIEDFITLNIDIRQFLQDVIDRAEGPDLLDAAWRALTSISILDPTCGSGAFLFAALNVLEPLYEAAIARMDSMVSDWRRAHPGAPLPTGNSYVARFAQRLADLARHPSPRYFVLKTIVLQNLYGVDIMPEAVEICKLRLFLKLVAQLESADQIEPLPDLDFNVRAGNTLVGFATHAQAKDAITSDIAEAGSWPGIEYAAEQASGTFKLFRDAQADPNARAEDISGWKRLLNEQLEELRTQLDTALARQYGIDDPAAKPKKFATWRESHQPFHWFVEFYGILHEGGFEAIIGNPPYVAMSKLRKQYSLYGFETNACSDMYAPVLERVTKLLSKVGWTGMIVPLSLTFSGDFDLLRRLLYQKYSGNWFSSFARIPAALFNHDVRVRNTIQIGARTSKPITAATRLHRWFEEARDVLFAEISYSSFTPETWENKIPRIPSAALGTAFEDLLRDSGRLQNAFIKNGKHELHFKKSAYNWLCFCKKLPPCYGPNAESIEHTEFGAVSFHEQRFRDVSLLLTNGKLNFAWWSIMGDDFHVAQWMFASFPLDVAKLPAPLMERLIPIASELECAMKENTSFKLNAGKRVGNYNLARCRDVTDKSDAIFAEALGLDGVWEEIELLYARIVKTDFTAE